MPRNQTFGFGGFGSHAAAPSRKAHRARTWMKSFMSTAAGRRLGMNGARLVDRRAADFLLQARPLALLVRRELHRLAALRRAVERADHAHVGEALFRAGLGVVVLQRAVGEVEEFWRELVALREAPLFPLAVDGQPVLQRHRVLV